METKTLTLAQTLELIQANPAKLVDEANFNEPTMDCATALDYFSEYEEDTMFSVLMDAYSITISL